MTNPIKEVDAIKNKIKAVLFSSNLFKAFKITITKTDIRKIAIKAFAKLVSFPINFPSPIKHLIIISTQRIDSKTVIAQYIALNALTKYALKLNYQEQQRLGSKVLKLICCCTALKLKGCLQPQTKPQHSPNIDVHELVSNIVKKGFNSNQKKYALALS